MGGSVQEKRNEHRATKAGLPLMSFAKVRNFRSALRLIIFGVGSGGAADRRLKWEFRVRGLELWCSENLTAISGPQKRISGDDQSQLLFVGFIR